MFWNGSTAIDGLSGRASGASAGDVGGATVAGRTEPPNRPHPTDPERCTGRSMFLRVRLA